MFPPFISFSFQSTPPVKAATSNKETLINQEDISIHAAREGGDASAASGDAPKAISIHAAREGGDPAPGFSAS